MREREEHRHKERRTNSHSSKRARRNKQCLKRSGQTKGAVKNAQIALQNEKEASAQPWREQQRHLWQAMAGAQEGKAAVFVEKIGISIMLRAPAKRNDGRNTGAKTGRRRKTGQQARDNRGRTQTDTSQAQKTTEQTLRKEHVGFVRRHNAQRVGAFLLLENNRKPKEVN